jgi:hypothetical protein
MKDMVGDQSFFINTKTAHSPPQPCGTADLGCPIPQKVLWLISQKGHKTIGIMELPDSIGMEEEWDQATHNPKILSY